MKKVGLVSCYFKNNYGSMLQAYATQKTLDNMNIENETLNVSENIDFKKGKAKYYKSQIFNFKFIKSKFGMIKLTVDKKIHKRLGKNIAIRTKKYEEFKKEFRLTKPFYTYKEMTEYSKNFSSVLLGSDQLWLPVNVVADYYTLNWVPDEINKISYATSFGISEIPNKYKNLYEKFLKRINYISVREDKGCKIVEDLIGKEATLVCDPTLLLTKGEWAEIQEKEPIIKEKYILCYFLGKNIEHRKFAEKLREKTGYKIVSLNHADEYVKYSDKFADITPYDIGPKEFLNLIKNAQYVCTDSFHGTIFSLINNIEFFTFERYKNKNAKISTNSRIHSLLGIMNLQRRILKGNENIDEILEDKINFDYVNEELMKFREKSKGFLKKALSETIKEQEQEKQKRYIEITDKSECCGCTACKNICPVNAIEMQEDEEGFLYPVINKEKCINCGACKKICPVINKVKEEPKKQEAYLVNNKNNEIRKESTSGGAFSAIAEYVIDRDGVVFGASFDKEFNVEHTYATTKEELKKFRGSKYVQSNLENTFQEAKGFLEGGRMVLFSGTPCQIEGLKKYLNKDYENLITVDVVCHAVPSPKFWRKYLNYQKNKLEINDIKEIRFRDKRIHGYKYSNLTIEYNDSKRYAEGVETDPYLRAFFGDLSDRPACYNCAFKKQYRVSDITIWDCFNIGEFDKNLDDDIGTTRVLIQSKKGAEVFKQIKGRFDYKEVSLEKMVKNVREMYKSVNTNPKRKNFWEDVNNMTEEKVIEKYFPNSVKNKLEKRIRIILAETGIYNKVKKIAKAILRR